MPDEHCRVGLVLAGQRQHRDGVDGVGQGDQFARQKAAIEYLPGGLADLADKPVAVFSCGARAVA